MLKRPLFALIFGVMICGSSSHHSYAKNGNVQNAYSAQERGTEKHPIVVETIPKAPTAAESDQKKRQDEEKAGVDRKLVELTGKLALYTGLLFGATVGLALGTAGLVVVGFLQVRDAKNSIGAAVRAADAALQSANAAETALNKLEGPIIRPHEMVFRHDGETGRITFCFRNFGRSPAEVYRVSAIIIITPANSPGTIQHHITRNFMFDEMIAEKESSDPLVFVDDVLRQYGDSIEKQQIDLHFIVNFTWKSLLGPIIGGGTRFIWSEKRQKFLSGVQLWDDPSRFPPNTTR